MSGLRSLAICYLAAASVFTLAGVLSEHRTSIGEVTGQLRQRVESGLRDFARSGDEPARRLELTPPGPNDARTLAHVKPLVLPQAKLAARVQLAAPEPLLILPDLPPLPPELKTAAASGDDVLTPDQRVAVTARLRGSLTPELLRNFSLFLYVSSASGGPLAQRLYIFQKNAQGGLELAHDWAASTGREQVEISPQGRRSFTATPHGIYQLDPARMYAKYHSTAWDQSMPYAMFFNWENHGTQTGLAIHAADGDDIAKLGSRASAGCIHLSPEHAQLLFNLIRSQYRGSVPRFAYDAKTASMSNRGDLMHGADGKLKMADGYQVLTVIENFGGEDLIASLY